MTRHRCGRELAEEFTALIAELETDKSRAMLAACASGEKYVEEHRTAFGLYAQSEWADAMDTKTAARLDFKRFGGLSRMVLEEILVPKAGLEPARISTVDFESTASTDFATSALKGMRKRVGLYLPRAAMQVTILS